MNVPISVATIQRTIDAAKVFFDLSGPLSDEPRLTPDQLFIRELGHVLEEAFGLEEKEAVCLILAALRGGVLKARLLNGHVIPTHQWPDSSGRAWVNWYWGRIWLNACDGYDGAYPILDRADVVAWLRTLSPSSTGGRPRDRERAASLYELEFPNGHEGLTWEDVERRIGYSKSTIQRGLGKKF